MIPARDPKQEGIMGITEGPRQRGATPGTKPGAGQRRTTDVCPGTLSTSLPNPPGPLKLRLFGELKKKHTQPEHESTQICF